ncbi:MAG: LysR family transcriptional regulator [Pseudomonadota bacterium]
MNLETMDLNLLKVFDAMMHERNVTKAASRLGLSQPAVSKALARLRVHLKDELFIRQAQGMVATARALELAPTIGQVLRMLADSLDVGGFDPATSDRTFRLVAVDIGTSALLPRIASTLASSAPGINLRLYPARGGSLEMLDQHIVDFGLLPDMDVPERFGKLPLGPIEFCVLMRRNHPLSKRPLRLEDYVTFPHLMVTFDGSAHSFVDDVLAKRNTQRRIAMTVNSFAAGIPIVAATDMLFSTPRRFAEMHARLANLVMRDVPFGTSGYVTQSVLIWNRKLTSHPAYDWFRGVIHACSQPASSAP